MPVSNAHLDEAVRVWDGKEFSMKDRKTAQDLVRKNKVQIAENLQSKDLKTADEFSKEDVAKPRLSKKARHKQKYAHREMKAETE